MKKGRDGEVYTKKKKLKKNRNKNQYEMKI